MFFNQSDVDFPNWWDDLGTRKELAYVGEEDLSDPRPGAASESGEEDFPERDNAPSSSSRRSGANRVGEKGEAEAGSAYRPSGYDHEVIHAVWAFAEAVPGNDADLWRKDEFGNWIHRLDYGNRRSEFGWEVFDPGIGRHHQGIYAMRPMQWESYLRAYDFLGS